MDNEFIYEKEKLRETVVKISNSLEGSKKNLTKLITNKGYDPITLSNLIGMAKLRVRNLKKSSEKPYFARIDFKEEGNLKTKQMYIGKVGVFDLEGNIIVTDWRAPVSSVYYDGHLGKVQYTAPMGVIKGELNLKRQIVIENAILESIFDVDSVSDDELLKPYLGASADSRLKNIVASIQKEQNDIIRAPIHKNVIVQGVAGSGKTTVALHKIAYLIYNYDKKYKANQFMVIGPNKFFIKYISNVLPDLDVGNAKQSTFEEFAKEYINENFNVSDLSQSLVSLVNGVHPPEYLSYKLSMKYKEAIDRFIKDLENSLIAKEGVSSNGFVVFSKDDILNELHLYEQVDNISSKFKTVIQRLKVAVQRDDTINKRMVDYFSDLAKEASEEEKKEIFNKKLAFNTEYRTHFDKLLKKILNVKTKKVMTLYKNFIQDVEKYVNDENMAKEIKEKSFKKVSKREVEFEDIPALMYIKYSLFGEDVYKDFAHVVIDEAQDLGDFNFFVLKKILSQSTFSIFGDLTQGIYSYRAIKGWEQVQENTFDSKCDILKLEKSYRTTIEIMSAANLVSKHIGLGEGVPVIRHGDMVLLTKLTLENRAEYILEQISKAKENKMESIALICKTNKESEYLYEILSKRNGEIKLITKDNDDYTGGICILTSYLAKGLEFDSVIICNVDEDTYSSNSEIDMKLLYVAMTRALHTLELIYFDTPTKAIEKL